MATTVERLGAITNLTHAFIYFFGDATRAYDELGLTGRQHYFAPRAAAMGPVGPEIVTATFFNFCPGIVETAIPSAWDIATPAEIQTARLQAAGRGFEEACGDLTPADVAEATTIAESMVDGVGDAGKPLAAANRAVDVPDDPHIRLWQLITIIREWRGDAHIGVLNSAPVNAVEALVLHAATGVMSVDGLRSTRAWSDHDWAVGITALTARGLVDASGAFTEAGEAYRNQIEADTNRASQPLVDAVGDAAAQRLYELLRPVRASLLASGVFAQVGR